MNPDERLLKETIQTRKMLTALLKSSNQIHWVGGYAPGKTKSGDPYLILYPKGEQLEHKICRVYPHDFKKLPDFISREIPQGVGNGNPKRDEAKQAGNYKGCPMFCILTFHGKETNFGREIRFSDVLFVPTQN